jgi:glycosyltransferase involved in cell wall biosynthesis
VTLSDITPVLLTFNEQENIRRALQPLQWAPRIILLDSGSIDQTLAIVSTFRNVATHSRKFDNHTAQWNYAIDLVQTEWVLALDADYVTDENFAEELRNLSPSLGTNAFFAHFVYYVFGRPLRGSLYPPRAVLFRRGKARYIQDGHTQLLHFEGSAGFLRTAIRHDDRKFLAQWLDAQDKYALLEVEKLNKNGGTSFRDSVRMRMIFAPLLTLFYCLFAKGLILNGWPGWYYSFQRALAEFILSLRLIEYKMRCEKQ